jgi:hypothetical protein
MSAPLLLFVYNRPDHTKATLKALSENIGIEDTVIHIFGDGPVSKAPKTLLDDIELVRKIVCNNEHSLNIETHFSDENNGLANSIIGGVNEIINTHGEVIVLEDDLICSKYFLQYINACLRKYKEESKIMHVGGYSPSINFKSKDDIYFLSFASSWGWATWKDRWKEFIIDAEEIIDRMDKSGAKSKFNFYDSYPFYNMIQQQINGDVDSWAIRWNATVFLNNGLGVYPTKSLVQNIGFDGSGVHSGKGRWYDVKTSQKFSPILGHLNIVEDEKVRRQYGQFYKGLNSYSIWQKVKDKIKHEIKNAKGTSH